MSPFFKKYSKVGLSLFALLFLSFNARAQKINFAMQESFEGKQSDKVIKPVAQYITMHKNSIEFLDTQMLVNRIVKNDSLYCFFSVIYKSNIKTVVQNARKSHIVTNFKTIKSNNRQFSIIETNQSQIIILYKEPVHETKIGINVLAEDQKIARSFFKNIGTWLKKIKRR